MTLPTLSEYFIEEDFKQFCEDVDRVLSSTHLLIEDEIKSKSKLEFIKELATSLKIGFAEFLTMFKEKVIFTMFNAVGWSISKLYKALKSGYNAWGEVHNIIAVYIAKNKVVKFSRTHLNDLDALIKKSKVLNAITGVALAGVLAYQWISLISFTGNAKFDFNQAMLIKAFQGKAKIGSVLASPSGIKMMMFIGTGVTTGISFPWPSIAGGGGVSLFVLSILYTLSKKPRAILLTKIKERLKK